MQALNEREAGRVLRHSRHVDNTAAKTVGSLLSVPGNASISRRRRKKARPIRSVAAHSTHWTEKSTVALLEGMADIITQ